MVVGGGFALEIPSLIDLVGAVTTGDNRRAVELAKEILLRGASVQEIVQHGLSAALQSLGEKCTNYDFSLLELMLAGRAMLDVIDKVVGPEMMSGAKVDARNFTIVMGTIEGDIHDLGRRVWAMLLKVKGFKVIELGNNVPPRVFVEAASKEGADVIGVSSLITLTSPTIRQIRPLARQAELRTRVIAGGAAVHNLRHEELGVDFVAKDAFEALRFVEELYGVETV